MTWRSAAILVLAAALVSSPSNAQESQITVGFLATFSGPFGIMGQHAYDGFTLALDQAGGKIAGHPTKVVKKDDQTKADVGLQATMQMIEQDKVDLIVGAALANVIMAVAQPAANARVIMLGPIAGPGAIAGKRCSPYFFSTSWQNSEPTEAMGHYLQSIGVKRLYAQVPNFEGGKDVIAGLKRSYTGTLAGEKYTPMSQQDFSAELTEIQAANPDAVFVFYPGLLSVNFVKQYSQGGLLQKYPLYSASTIDPTTLPAIGDAAIGTYQTASWNVDLPNQANKDFVAAFEAKYNYVPSAYAAYAYDAARLIEAAVKEVGNASDRPALIKALMKANFASVRGSFSFSPNHFPIQDFYLLKAEKNTTGKLVQVTQKKIFENHVNSYGGECTMKAD